MTTNKVFAALLLSGAIVAGGGGAQARTANGVTFPDTVDAGGQTLQLNGIGKRVFALIVDGYASALYLPKPAHTADAIVSEPGPKFLYTQFLHTASANQIRDEYTAVYNRYCSSHPCSPQSKLTFNKILDTVTPMKPGDTVTYLIDNGTLTYSINNKPVVTANDPEYTRGMVEALVGPAAPTAGYRNGLIGG